MTSRSVLGGSLAAIVGAAAMMLTVTTAEAAMSPAPAAGYSSPDIQLAWCAAGLRVGPLGACIAGGPGWRGPGWRGPGWRGGYWAGRRCWRGYNGVLHCN